MPFSSDEILTRFAQISAAGRLSHAYLLYGASRMTLQTLGEKLAASLLPGDLSIARHPDFHLIQPESKSRRIRIEQIRDLEKSLHLKSYSGSLKITLLCEVERMCLGGADAANAFLKTLEEPQPGTLLILTSAEPQLVLPTILSRCVRLQVREGAGMSENAEMSSSVPSVEDLFPEEKEFLDQWFSLAQKESETETGSRSPGSKSLNALRALSAYARAALFTQRCQQLREAIEAAAEEAQSGAEENDEAEEAGKALIEGEYLLARRRLIEALEYAVWHRSPSHHLPDRPAVDHATLQTLRALEELNGSLQQNVDQSLAVERATLRLIDIKP